MFFVYHHFKNKSWKTCGSNNKGTNCVFLIHILHCIVLGFPVVHDQKWKADMKGAELVSLPLLNWALSYPSNHPSINLSFLLSTYLFIYPSIYVSIHLLVHLFNKHCLRVSSPLCLVLSLPWWTRLIIFYLYKATARGGPCLGGALLVETLLKVLGCRCSWFSVGRLDTARVCSAFLWVSELLKTKKIFPVAMEFWILSSGLLI